MNRRPISRLLLPRVMILAVLVINLQCALAFIVNPLVYVASFELVGEPGRAAVIGIGILFLMWQVPYVFALFRSYYDFAFAPEKKLALFGGSGADAGNWVGRGVVFAAVCSSGKYDVAGGYSQVRPL